MENLNIGQVAKKTGVTVQTVRFYERKGLIPKALRAESGYRKFPPETVRRIEFIRGAKRLGFGLKDTGQFLALAEGVDSDCGDILDFAVRKITEVEQKIKELNNLRKVLVEGVRTCPREGPVSMGPILDIFKGDDNNE